MAVMNKIILSIFIYLNFFSFCQASNIQKPNIILIMTDDSGYSDIGAYGGEISTPNIDLLANEGIMFQRFYTNAKCSPTRASLMTGQYPQNVGVGDLARPRDETPFPGYQGYLDLNNNVTVAEALKLGGYQTLMTGKWHLGGENQVNGQFAKGEMLKWPLARGFDKFFGLLHGAAHYYKPKSPRLFRLGNEVFNAKDRKGFYATDTITDFSIEFVKQAVTTSDKPFFLYIPYTAPHTPREAPRELVEKYKKLYSSTRWNQLQNNRYQKLHKKGLIKKSWQPHKPIESALTVSDQFIRNMALHAAMTEKVDQNIGRVVTTLKELKEYENTLIIYLSDNGAEWPVQQLANTPFEGVKANLREGGILTHFIMHWPNGVKRPGRVIKKIGHVIDVMPTLLDIAGVDYPTMYKSRKLNALNGKSFAKVLTENDWEGHRTLHWDTEGWQSLIAYPWKYTKGARGRYFLYNLENDATERNNLAAKFPEKLWELSSQHAQWAKNNNVIPYELVESAKKKFVAHKLTALEKATVWICSKLSNRFEVCDTNFSY